jgi:hypothetical protein
VLKSVNSLCRGPLFLAADPGLRLVHIVRHPCGVIASRLEGVRQGLMPDQAFIRSLFEAFDLTERGYEEDEVRRWSMPRQYALQWMTQNEKLLDELEGHPRYLRVRYEDLCTEPGATLEALFEGCGLNLDAQTQGFVEQLEREAPEEAGYFSVLRNPRASLDRWKTRLDAATIAEIEEVVADSRAGRLYH